MMLHKIAIFALGAASVQAAFNNKYYAAPWLDDSCAGGVKQTPINIEPITTTPAPSSWATEMVFPTVTDMNVENTGHGMQLSWDTFVDGTGDVLVKVAGESLNSLMSSSSNGTLFTMAVKPLQLHFHVVSEHAIDGLYYPAEMHIVTAIAEGQAPPDWGCDTFWQTGNTDDLVLDRCISVFGVLYKYGDMTPKFIKDMMEAFPLAAEDKVPLNGTLDLNTVLPLDKSYWTYEGSLTTPPCTEGLRWHLFKTPMTITQADVERMELDIAETFDPENPDSTLVYRTNHRAMQPLNERMVYSVPDVAAAPATSGEVGNTAMSG